MYKTVHHSLIDLYLNIALVYQSNSQMKQFKQIDQSEL